MRQGLRDHAVKLPRVHRITRRGKIYRYHRVTRALLPDLPETHPAFIEAWAAQEALAPRPAKGAAATGTLAHAVQDTVGGHKFAGLSEGYRAMMRREFDAIRTDYGDLALAKIQTKHIRADLGKLAPVQSNKRLRAWRLVFSHSVTRGWIDVDPSVGIKKQAENTKDRAPWTEAEIEKFRKRWPIGTTARGCFELIWWAGCRVDDAATMAWAHVSPDGVLAFRQGKTGGMAYVPWTSPLPAWARGWEQARAEAITAVRAVVPGGFMMLGTRAGKARSGKGLSNLISIAAREAKIEGKTAHGLRAGRLTAIAEAGGSTQAIMSWGGHKTLREAEHYTATADRRRQVMGEEHLQNDVKHPAPACKTSKNA